MSPLNDIQCIALFAPIHKALLFQGLGSFKSEWRLVICSNAERLMYIKCTGIYQKYFGTKSRFSNRGHLISIKRPSTTTSTRHVKVTDNVNVAVVVAVVALVLVVVDGFSKKVTAGKMRVLFSTMEKEWCVPGY
jgi:hypothetical protein